MDGPRAYLLHKLERATREGAREIVLTDEDIEKLTVSDRLPLPDAFAVHASLLRPHGAEPSDGPRFYLHGCYGPSGATLLGRFCYGDELLTRYVREHHHAEEALDPGAVFAEIVHAPQGRVGNITFRPYLRDYEIPLLATSGASPDRQIELADLLVTVDERGIHLFSQRLGRRVIPRLTTAHNYSHPSNLAIYRFLAALQNQHSSRNVSWTWEPFQTFTYLPRLRYRRAVLAREQWRLTAADAKAVAAARSPMEAMSRLRSERGMPRFIALQQGDNELPVDLENVISVEAFVEELDGQPATITALAFDGSELCLHAEDGRYTNEVLIPFVRRAERVRSAASAPAMPSTAVRRSFPPGSEWLYLKLYCGPAALDVLLTEAIAPLVHELTSAGVVDRWFFIRYGDPESHLRLRLHGAAGGLRDVPARLQHLMPQFGGAVWKVQLDTYEREVERYGGPECIELAEELFCADSIAAIRFLASGGRTSPSRWEFALRGLLRLFADFGLDLAAAEMLAAQSRDALAAELGSAKDVRIALGNQFRSQKRSIFRTSEQGVAPQWERLLDDRSRTTAGVAERIRHHMANGGRGEGLLSVLNSFAHMSVNRLMSHAQRQHELVLYEFIVRICRANHARGLGGMA